jgi:hypothetical protein
MLRGTRVKERIARALIEVGFIVFLFYANLLMGEYEHSGMGQTRGLRWAVSEIRRLRRLRVPQRESALKVGTRTRVSLLEHSAYALRAGRKQYPNPRIVSSMRA